VAKNVNKEAGKIATKPRNFPFSEYNGLTVTPLLQVTLSPGMN
jgi:hypothetical protein